ncbi:MAG: hypothetical protein A2Y10_06405 [Planctomycetes bacterium GWF2_41_51]|nr:MAG: hypothetical protein A2Y10_06405 [Planctomycetes bacterium GWF2_41_51]HBG26412.1 hypothetical protein [Phycisphaerales bacterium]
MAKRVNKKIAIIGSVVLVIFVLGAIAVVLKLNRDPHQFIKDAEIALALDEPDYKAAEKAYGSAFAYAKKNTELKIEILFKLVDMYMDMNDWRKAAGCWNNIINFDTKNLKARQALLDYSYQIAASGNWTVWKDVESNVSDIIEKELDTSPRMHRIKGQAMLELVRRGQMTDKEKSVNETIEILQKVIQSEPNNVDTYQYLADALVLKGEILAAKGILNANENSRQEADKILLKGIEQNPSEPKAYINLYSSQLAESKNEIDKIKKVESEIVKLTQKFPESHLVYYALTQLYLKNPKDSEKAIAAIEKAIELDKQNVNYSLTASTLYYRKSLVSSNPADFKKAVDIATQALTFPDSLDVPGPKARVSMINRYSLHTFLANCYLDETAEENEKTQKAKWLEFAKQEVHQINQILGSADNPYSIMWQGRILLADGQKADAVKLMYDAYQKLTVSSQNQSDPQIAILAYELAKAFSDSPESGAVGMFYLTAYKNRMYESKPQMLLDFASSLMRMRDWKHAIDLIESYEQYYGETDASRQLRISAYIGSNMYEQTEEKLAGLSDDDPNILRLKNLHLNAIISKTVWDITQNQPADGTQNVQVEQLKAKLEETKIKSIAIRDKLASIGIKQLTEAEFTDICKRYFSEEEYKKAGAFIDNYYVSHPNSVNARMYKLFLAEPSPVNVPPERSEAIMLRALEDIKEPIQREFLVGQFYHTKGEKDQAIIHYQKVLDISPDNSSALANLFNILLAEEDYKYAEKLAQTARKYNTDLCEGEFFNAKIAYAKKDYQSAVTRVNTCLEKRPIFSEAYLLRSQCYTALNKEADSIADAKKAYELNPYDSIIPRNLAFVLYNRNLKLGNAASIDQTNETRSALETAIRANPRDVDLQNFYAKYISTTEPDRAIAVSQQIQKMQPTIENSLWLASLAMDVANKSSAKQKNTYYAIAEDAYKDAYAINPNDQRVLNGYAEYFRVVGRPEDGQKLLSTQNDLLWRYYARIGKIEDAQKILSKLYDANPKDANNVKGMLFIARNRNDQANILKYSSELVKLDKSLENQIVQIESTLEIGLSDEAKVKLDSLSEQNPDDPKLAFLKAWLAAKQGKLEESLTLANRNLELDAANARAWRLRGQINTAMNNFNNAINDFQKSKALSDNAEVRIDLARAYARTNAVEQAISELKIAADEQGSSVARDMLEELFFMTGNTDRVAKFYSETIAKFPDNVYWYNHAGNFALRTKEYETAYKLFDAAFQNSLKANNEQPDAEAFDGKLRTLLVTKKYEQLQAEATKYLDSALAPIAYERMAEAKADVGEKEAAVEYFKRALEKAGTNETYLIGILGLMNNVVGYDETIKWCNEKIQTQPDSLAVNLALFNLHNIKEQYNKALEYIDKSITVSADDEQKNFTCRMNKTKLLLKMFEKMADKEYLKLAIGEYESILNKQPNNIEVMNNLAYLLADNGLDVAKAMGYGKKAYDGAPNNASILDTYAYVLFKNDKTKEADELINRSVQQYEQNKMNAPIEVYEHMAMIKEKLGQNDKALEAYKRALEFSGNNAPPEVKNRITAAIERLNSK